MIENSLEKLLWEMKIKSKVLLEVAKSFWLKVIPFETWRSRARQQRLYTNKKPWQPVAKPGTSMHEKGKAVDWVFVNTKWQVTWSGDYRTLTVLWAMCWVVPVPGESCHLQDNWKTIVTIMTGNSKSWLASKNKITQKQLSAVNTCFRKYWYK